MSDSQTRISTLEADLECETQATRRLMIERDHYEDRSERLVVLLHSAIAVIESCGENAQTFESR